MERSARSRGPRPLRRLRSWSARGAFWGPRKTHGKDSSPQTLNPRPNLKPLHSRSRVLVERASNRGPRPLRRPGRSGCVLGPWKNAREGFSTCGLKHIFQRRSQRQLFLAFGCHGWDDECKQVKRCVWLMLFRCRERPPCILHCLINACLRQTLLSPTPLLEHTSG